MTTPQHIGIDMGGSKLLVGLLDGDTITRPKKEDWNGHQLVVSEVMETLYQLVDPLMSDNVRSIGIGVPGTVDLESGIVYDLENIPDWKEVALKQILESRYQVPVFINNDSNCFALGESRQAYAVGAKSMAAITIGTGLGVGIVIDHMLYTGRNCGAGEFGPMPYLDKTIEYYASGHFFKLHGTSGQAAFQRARTEDPEAMKLFAQFGRHLGNAIRFILFALDPELIILGGSVSKAYPYFSESMSQSLSDFPFRNVRQNVTIKISGAEDSTLLGAASLWRSASRVISY